MSQSTLCYVTSTVADSHTNNFVDDGKDQDPYSSFLLMPSLVREKVYTYLRQRELLNLRRVCLPLLDEIDNFADFSVIMNSNSYGEESEANSVSIPFRYLKLLTIDNDEKDLPWDWDMGPEEALIDEHLQRNSSFPVAAPEEHRDPQINGSIQAVHLGAISFVTFLHLSRYRSIQAATLTTSTFIRPIPSLGWTQLRTLSVKFYVQFNQVEQFMLDNFDSLCVQTFPQLETLSIAMCNTVYPNIQSAYSIRILRFVTKHWRTLRTLDVTMEAECCVSHHYAGPHMCPGLSQLDLDEMRRVKLKALTLNATELTCPRCCIWQEFIKEQTELQSLEISISCATRLHSSFFCPVQERGTELLQSISVTLWGMDGYYPFDFRHLEGAGSLKSLELVRHAHARNQLSRPELLNVSKIPQGLVSLTLNGFLISSEDVPTLLESTTQLTNLILIDCGFGLDIGVLVEHIAHISRHPSYATAIIDFNSPVISSDEAITVLFEEMDKQKLVFQYLFEISSNKNHRFWFVHPDRVELARDTSTLEKAGYSKDVLLNCDIISQYTDRIYFDDEFDEPDLPPYPHLIQPPNFHDNNNNHHHHHPDYFYLSEQYHHPPETIPILS